MDPRVLDQFALATLITAAGYGAIWYEYGFRASPDGNYYLKAALDDVPRPYAWRALGLTQILRSPGAWQVLSMISLIVSGGLLGVLTGHPIIAAILFVGLPGLFRTNVILKVLVDAPALMCALGAFAALASGHLYTAFFLAALAGKCKETAPFFLAAWTFYWPFAAIGVVCVALSGMVKSGEPDQHWLLHPFSAAREMHEWQNWQTMLLPWGALLIVTPPTWSVIVSLGLGYSQLLVAQDNARLYQWAAPALIIAACVHPPAWIGLALIAHWCNPYKGI